MDAVPELIDLLNELHGKAIKWYDIGIQLHLSPEELDVIERDSSGVYECFRNMLKKWLRTLPTWRSLIKALKTPAVDEQVLAEELEAKFTVPQPSGRGVNQMASESMHRCYTVVAVCIICDSFFISRF